jgi:hypothetical protein
MEVVEIYTIGDRVRVMVFNTTFNNISVTLQRSLSLEETEENH